MRFWILVSPTCSVSGSLTRIIMSFLYSKALTRTYSHFPEKTSPKNVPQSLSWCVESSWSQRSWWVICDGPTGQIFTAWPKNTWQVIVVIRSVMDYGWKRAYTWCIPKYPSPLYGYRDGIVYTFWFHGCVRIDLSLLLQNVLTLISILWIFCNVYLKFPVIFENSFWWYTQRGDNHGCQSNV